MSRSKKTLYYAAAVLFWLGVWHVIATAVGQEVLLVSPVAVLRRILLLWQEPDFWPVLGSSLFRILIGFTSAVALGILLGILTAKSRFCRTLFAPVRALIKATPVASFILLAFVWMYTGTVPAFISFLMVLPTVWQNIEQGIVETDPALLEMADAYRFSRFKRIRLIYIPGVLPYFLAAFSSGLGLGFKSGIAAEVIALPKQSIGINMYYAKIYLETPDLLAWTVIVVLLSILFEWGLVRLVKKALGYRGKLREAVA
jgi:NitT/TauT family transport system permease protein